MPYSLSNFREFAFPVPDWILILSMFNLVLATPFKSRENLANKGDSESDDVYEPRTYKQRKQTKRSKQDGKKRNVGLNKPFLITFRHRRLLLLFTYLTALGKSKELLYQV